MFLTVNWLDEEDLGRFASENSHLEGALEDVRREKRLAKELLEVAQRRRLWNGERSGSNATN